MSINGGSAVVLGKRNSLRRTYWSADSYWRPPIPVYRILDMRLTNSFRMRLCAAGTPIRSVTRATTNRGVGRSIVTEAIRACALFAVRKDPHHDSGRISGPLRI